MNDCSILVVEALIFASSYFGDRIIELPNRYETVAPSGQGLPLSAAALLRDACIDTSFTLVA